MKKQLSPEVIESMMNRAVDINNQCPEQCRDFRIMTSPMRENTLILRWTVIDITDIDRPVQCFRYECFYLDGKSQNCSVNYATQKEANAFFSSLETHYQQECCMDHLLGN